MTTQELLRGFFALLFAGILALGIYQRRTGFFSDEPLPLNRRCAPIVAPLLLPIVLIALYAALRLRTDRAYTLKCFCGIFRFICRLRENFRDLGNRFRPNHFFRRSKLHRILGIHHREYLEIIVNRRKHLTFRQCDIKVKIVLLRLFRQRFKLTDRSASSA